ncbi:MAG: HAD family phosphatase [Clostridia bacterium]|nr:HAD family phosphatase [Clostridia bacterium]
MKITTIIFDIGNVLAEFCWERHFRSFGFSEETFQRLAKATVLDDTWDQFDKGVLSFEELKALFIQNDPGIKREIEMVLENISPCIEVYDYAYDWIRELKAKGYRVYILSNFSEKCYMECGEKMNFVKEADGAVISYLEKMIKPEPCIYELLMERYHLEPQECVFMDDKKINIDAARALGMKGIVFTTKAAAVEELRSLIEEN